MANSDASETNSLSNPQGIGGTIDFADPGSVQTTAYKPVPLRTTGPFPLPTDQEISEMMGGIPVTSHHPEDLPHFRSPLYGGLNNVEISDRKKFLADKFFSFRGFADYDEKSVEFQATTFGAGVITFRNAETGELTYFSLVRPSQFISPADGVAANLGITGDVTIFPIPKEHFDFIVTYSNSN